MLGCSTVQFTTIRHVCILYPIIGCSCSFGLCCIVVAGERHKLRGFSCCQFCCVFLVERFIGCYVVKYESVYTCTYIVWVQLRTSTSYQSVSVWCSRLVYTNLCETRTQLRVHVSPIHKYLIKLPAVTIHFPRSTFDHVLLARDD